MKKKLLILLVFLLLLAGVICMVIQMQKENEKEEKTPEMIAFETKVKEMYGEQGYIGPMTEEIEPLTEEELQKLNPNGELRTKQEDGFNNITMYGRFNKKKIRNAYDAREAAYQALQYAEEKYESDTFLYVKERCIPERLTDYVFERYYKGVQVYGERVIVTVKDKGNTYCVDNFMSGEIFMSSVDPKFTKEDVLAYIEQKYGGDYWLYDCFLQLYNERNEENGKVWRLRWNVAFGSPDFSGYELWIDADTGEILHFFDEESVNY